MTARITNAGLAEKIDAVHESLRDMRKDVKENTKFRQNAAGFVAGISVVGVLIGSIVTWAITHINRGN